jgi:hypothetical protein
VWRTCCRSRQFSARQVRWAVLHNGEKLPIKTGLTWASRYRYRYCIGAKTSLCLKVYLSTFSDIEKKR